MPEEQFSSVDIQAVSGTEEDPIEGPLSAEQQSQVVEISERVLHHRFLHSGPLPHPRTLVAYEQVQPGFAERIFSMAEKQAEHRQAMEKVVILGGVKAQGRGLTLAFILGVIGMLCSTGIVMRGHSLTGFGTFLTAFTALVAVFIYGRKQQRDERREQIELRSGNGSD